VIHYRDHIRIVAPTVDDTAPADPQPMAASRHTFWRDHVRAWRDSGLRRDAYAQTHGLELRTFNQWIARFRQMFHRSHAATPAHA
jgi:hypothetical protein